MAFFRKKVGKRTLAQTGEGSSLSTKNLGPKIGTVPSGVGTVSEEDGDGDGFRTGADGRDNVPVVKPVKEKLTDVWSDKRQKALKLDEEKTLRAASRLKKREPKYSLQELRNLMSQNKGREDVAATRKATREWAKSVFEMDNIGNNGEYKVRLYGGTTGVNIMGRKRSVVAANDEDPYLHVRISGQILDKDNKPVGVFERWVYLDDENSKKKPYVQHDILRIDEKHRGEGIGSDFTLASEIMYSKLGIDSIHLNAGLSDGAYTWLRAGYGFKNDKERSKAAKALEDRYQQMLKDAGSKEALVAGGFLTRVGRHFSDDNSEDDGAKMPEPLFESMKDLDKFLKMLGQLKGNPVGSENELPPASLTLFGDFSKRILRGMNFDVTKNVRQIPSEQKSLFVIRGLDNLITEW